MNLRNGDPEDAPLYAVLLFGGALDVSEPSFARFVFPNASGDLDPSVVDLMSEVEPRTAAPERMPEEMDPNLSDIPVKKRAGDNEDSA